MTRGVTSAQARRAAAKDRAARRRAYLKGAGLCTNCGSRDAAAGRLCIRCWFRAVASSRCGSADHAPVLQRLWVSQGGRCALTGLAMVPGDGASVDHKHPVSKGGAVDDPNNLRWVLTAANSAKGNLSDHELLTLCRLILDGPAARSMNDRDQGGMSDPTY